MQRRGPIRNRQGGPTLNQAIAVWLSSGGGKTLQVPPIIGLCIIQPPQPCLPVQLAMWLDIQATIEPHQFCAVVVDPDGFSLIHCSQVASM